MEKTSQNFRTENDDALVDDLMDAIFGYSHHPENSNGKYEVVIISSNQSLDTQLAIMLGKNYGLIAEDAEVVTFPIGGNVPELNGRKTLVINTDPKNLKGVFDQHDHHKENRKYCSADLFVKANDIKLTMAEKLLLDYVRLNDLTGQDQFTVPIFRILSLHREVRALITSQANPELIAKISGNAISAFLRAEEDFQEKKQYKDLPWLVFKNSIVTFFAPADSVTFMAILAAKKNWGDDYTLEYSRSKPEEVILNLNGQEKSFRSSVGLLQCIVDLGESSLRRDQIIVWREIIKTIGLTYTKPNNDYDRMLSPQARIYGFLEEFGLKYGSKYLLNYFGNFYRQQYSFHIIAADDFAKTKTIIISHSNILKRDINIVLVKSGSSQIVGYNNWWFKRQSDKSGVIDVHIIIRPQGWIQIFSRHQLSEVAAFWRIMELARKKLGWKNLTNGFKMRLALIRQDGNCEQTEDIYLHYELKMLLRGSDANPNVSKSPLSGREVLNIVRAVFADKPPYYFYKNSMCNGGCKSCNVNSWKLRQCFQYKNK